MNTSLLEAVAWADIFATKGAEYLLVITYLSLLVGFWVMLVRPSTRTRAARSNKKSWFALPGALSYHRGHTWVGSDGGKLVRVGLDDFAHQLVGKPERIVLPEAGDAVKRDKPLLALHRDGRSVDVLSPVDGEVVAVNPDALENPERAAVDPYGEGWLLQVRVPVKSGAFKPLFHGSKAKKWLSETVQRLTEKVSGSELGMVLQDGGEPVPGFSQEMSSGHWDEVAAEFLMTSSKVSATD